MGKNLKIGDLIKFNSVNCKSVTSYVEVSGFNDILPEYGGGRSVSMKGLGGGLCEAHVPEKHMENVVHFNSLREMQADIDRIAATRST